MNIKWVPVLVALALLAMILCFGRCPGRGSNAGIGARIASTLLRIRSAGYTPVTVTDDPFLPESVSVPEEHIVQTVYVHGSWTAPEDVAAGDTVPVEVSAVELIDGSKWVRLSIGGKPVSVDITAWSGPDPVEIVRRWQAHVEVAAVCDRPALGIGIGYRICAPLGIAIAPTIAAGPSLDWAAAELRLTRRVWSGVSVGIGGGYRIGDDPGLHLSAGIGVEL